MTSTAVGSTLAELASRARSWMSPRGNLISDRIKVATPEGGRPGDIVDTVLELFDELGTIEPDAPVGVCFPAIVLAGRTMSAANVSKKWIGLEAEKLFEKSLGRDIHFVNDADAAGVAEHRYGAAQGVSGLALLTTLGPASAARSSTMACSSRIRSWDTWSWTVRTPSAPRPYSAKERQGLSWEKWAKGLQRYYSHLEFVFSPELFIVGGGVSKNHEEFLPLLNLRTRIVPAVLRNNAGILGAAALAAGS